MVFSIVFPPGVACMLAGAICTLLSYASFDRVLRRACAESEEAWVKLGKPCGFFYAPPGTRVGFMTGFVRRGLYEKWAVVGEEPLAGSVEDIGKLRRYRRIAGWCYAIGVLLLVIAVAMILTE